MLALCSWSLKELKSGMHVLSSRGIFCYVYKLLWLVNIYFDTQVRCRNIQNTRGGGEVQQ